MQADDLDIIIYLPIDIWPNQTKTQNNNYSGYPLLLKLSYLMRQKTITKQAIPHVSFVAFKKKVQMYVQTSNAKNNTITTDIVQRVKQRSIFSTQI